MQSQIIRIQSNRVIGAEIITSEGVFFVISFYVRHTDGEGIKELEEMIMIAKDRTDKILAIGDANAHSKLWGKEETNYVGELFENLIVQHNLAILNDPSSEETFIDANLNKHWLDLSLGTTRIEKAVQRWTVMRDAIPVSDHYLISTVPELTKTESESRELLSWKSTDWELFNKTLLERLRGYDTYWKELTGSEDIDQTVKDVTQAFQDTIKELVPEKKICQFSKPWFNEDVKEKWRKMRKAKKLLLRSSKDKETFMTCRAEFQATVKIAKETSFRDFCSSFKNEDMWTKFNRLNPRKKSSDVPKLRWGEGWALSSEDKANVLNKRFFPSQQAEEDSFLKTLEIQEEGGTGQHASGTRKRFSTTS